MVIRPPMLVLVISRWNGERQTRRALLGVKRATNATSCPSHCHYGQTTILRIHAVRYAEAKKKFLSRQGHPMLSLSRRLSRFVTIRERC